MTMFEGGFTMKRLGQAAPLVLLVASACGTRLLKKTDAPPPPVVEAPRQEPVKGGATETEQAKQPVHLRVLGLLAEADALRTQILDNPDMRSLYILFDRLDGDGNRVGLDQRHAAYNDRDNADRIAQARARYETVLTMDPGKPQALLGLANLSMIEAMTFLTQRTELTYTLRTTDNLKSKPGLVKRRRMVKRKLRTALMAAQTKFQDVLSFSPREPSAHLGMAMVMAMGGRWKEAQAKLAEIEQERMFPPRARSVFYLWYGFVEEALGRFDDAIRHYAKAAELGEPTAWALWAENRVEEMYLYGVVQMEPPDEEDMRDSSAGEVTP